MKNLVRIASAILLFLAGAFNAYTSVYALGFVSELATHDHFVVRAGGWEFGILSTVAGICCVLAAGLLLIRPRAGRMLGIGSALVVVGLTAIPLLGSKSKADQRPPLMIYVMVVAMVGVAGALYREHHGDRIEEERAYEASVESSVPALSEPRLVLSDPPTTTQPTLPAHQPHTRYSVAAYRRYIDLDENAEVILPQQDSANLPVVVRRDEAGGEALKAAAELIPLKCPWCSVQLTTNATPGGLVFRCRSCQKQVLAHVTERNSG